ncbi:hypothetical protein D3C72_1486380 [compost metagenome]
MFLRFAQMLRAALSGFYLEQTSAQGGFRMRQAEALIHDGAAGTELERAVDQALVLLVAFGLLDQPMQHRRVNLDLNPGDGGMGQARQRGGG